MTRDIEVLAMMSGWVARCVVLISVPILITAGPRPLLALDGRSDFVGEALARRIISPDLALAEVRLFAEARVPRMPEVKDLADWQRQADRIRSDVLRQVVYRGEAAKWREAPTRVDWQETIAGGPGYRIKKLRYEAVPGFWVPALLYEPEKLEGKVPAVLNFDGHDPDGMFAGYKQVRCINLAKRGVIALNVDWIGMGQLKHPDNQHTMLNHIDLSGTSGLAVFYSLQTRGVDVLLAHEHVHPAKIAATGLSGGGWQTIFLGSMDPRVTLTVPVAGYSSFLTRANFPSDLGDSEQTPTDLATVTDYAQLTAMLAPRAALLTFNARDNCCFAADHALPALLDAARPIYRLYGVSEKLQTHVNHDPGTHNYLQDNREALYRMIGGQFFEGQADYPKIEIPSDAEIKSAEVLRVSLPPNQATLRSIALDLIKNLPEDPILPTEKATALAWQVAKRDQLAQVVRYQAVEIRPETVGTETNQGVTATRWKLRVGDHWTIPAVELVPVDPKGTTVLLADQGRREARVAAEELLAQGDRVLAVDLFDVGESRIAEKAWLWNLYVATVGARPLGLQAGQLAAIARWSAQTNKAPVKILAIGPRSSTTALVAAAIETQAIRDLDLKEAPGSLKEPIESATPYDQAPDRFCYGLLSRFDILQLTALTAPRKVQFQTPTPRTRTQLAGLKAWYRTLGEEFNPIP